MSDRRWTDADRELVRSAIMDCRWDAMSIEQAEAVLDALTAAGWRRDADVRAEVAEEIDEALRAMPCPEPERPGAGVTAEKHYTWMTEVLRVVRAHRNPPTDHAEGDHDAG